MKLYEVKQEILACVKLNEETAVNTETGEIIDIEALEALELEFNERVEGVALWIKEEKAKAAAIDAEIKALQARKKTHANKAEALTRYEAMILDGKKFETPKVAISFRKSEAVELVGDIYEVDENYLRYKEPELDKAAIKKALKAGEQINGVKLVERQSMVLK